MNIVFNLKENQSLSQKEREKILALLQEQVAGDIDMSVNDEPQKGVDNSTSLAMLSKELLTST